MRQEEAASRGSPEWAGSADSQRAVSLDASEPAAEISNPALVRSAALEDLTRVDDRSSWVNPAEAAAAAAFPDGSSDSPPDVPLGSEGEGPPARAPSGAAADSGGVGSPSQTGARRSQPDIRDDSGSPSSAVPTAGAELREGGPQSPPSRRSLVPVLKGLSPGRPPLTPATNFI